ncbi:MAG: FkbM family methyltransferase [Bacteroidetes bacterium]|nr:FkbM family methyltransferase [Bacteroidota bacterium]
MNQELAQQGGNKLIDKLTDIYEAEQKSRLMKWINNPFKRFYIFILNRISYPITHKGKYISANTFFGTHMHIQLPAAAEIYLTGAKVHRSEIQLCKWLLRENAIGKTFVDGGAHYGFYSQFFSFISENGPVYSFEPLSRTFSTLNLNKQQGQAVYNVALSDHDGFVTMTQPDIKNSEANEVVASSESDHRITCIKLDTLFSRLNVKPDYLKLDIEGHEYEALLGSIECIRAYKPVIILEIWSAAYRDNSNQIKAIEYLKNMGYQLYLIDDDGYVHICESFNQLNQTELDSLNVILKYHI